MSRLALLRVATLALAFVHTFPARSHLAAFFEAPCFADAWKGFGASIAVVLYLFPVRVQARGLALFWRSRKTMLRGLALLLVAVHAVPALDHLPRFIQSARWEDAWRGVGAAIAMLWFLAPPWMQARAFRALAILVQRQMPHLTPHPTLDAQHSTEKQFPRRRAA
jgi:hypothetical protein